MSGFILLNKRCSELSTLGKITTVANLNPTNSTTRVLRILSTPNNSCKDHLCMDIFSARHPQVITKFTLK